jgi:hypothetical protein
MLSVVRDQETIDSELRLLAAGRRTVREYGIEPSNRQVDELLDERLRTTPEAPWTPDEYNPCGAPTMNR